MYSVKGRRPPLASPLPLPPAILALFCVLLCQVAPVSGDYNKYVKVGVHALQMQQWKKAERSAVNLLQSEVSTKLANVMALNATAHAAIEQVSKHVAGLNGSYEYIMASLNALNGSSAPALSTPESAFQAFVSGAATSVTMSTSTAFKYADERLDENDDYSTATGLFTAPIRGLYWFHCTFTASGSGSRFVALMKINRASGATETIAYVKYYVSQETAATTMAVLEPGDTVGMYPESNYVGTVTMAGSYANTFCGYLMAKYKEPVSTPPSTTTSTTTTTGAAAVDTTTTTTTETP